MDFGNSTVIPAQAGSHAHRPSPILRNPVFMGSGPGAARRPGTTTLLKLPVVCPDGR
jgi:hypothetical protein